MPPPNQNAEQRARDKIDQQLTACGWVVQKRSEVNLSASVGVAVREYMTDAGPADYILFVEKKPVGVIEAKREEEGVRLTTVEDQSTEYATSKLKYLSNDPLPFVYESTGELTRFTDYRDPKPRSRPVFTFHKPETFREWLKQPKSLRARVNDLPALPEQGLRDCQIRAMNNLDVSFKQNRPKALLQMATGSGKTYTAITFIYRLLKFAGAKRVLFLVDTKNLGEQAEQEFMAYVPNDDNRKFTELYNVQRLRSSYVATDSQVCISTIQRLYSILQDKELEESAEEENPAEKKWQPKEPVLVIERNQTIGEKIRISGGGRCNFTNLVTEHEHYISENPHFCKSALARFTPEDFVALVRKHGIAYHEKTLGQLFCDGSSRQIITMLEKECMDAGVRIVVGSTIKDVRKGSRFVVTTESEVHECDSLVIATGGLSIPKMGATDLGYRLAQQFGLKVTHTTPGLVPLTFPKEDVSFFSELSGVSHQVVCRYSGQSFRENLLFTHRGLSGPAILQISSYWKPGAAISVDLSPDLDVGEFLIAHHRGSGELSAVLSEMLPKRLAKQLCKRYGWAKRLGQYSTEELLSIADQLHDWKLEPSGTEGYEKAEVTCGGVDTNELSSKTMEVRKVPGLFVIGEVVDVTGHLGGYNFQWAWASGYAAGQYA